MRKKEVAHNRLLVALFLFVLAAIALTLPQTEGPTGLAQEEKTEQTPTGLAGGTFWPTLTTLGAANCSANLTIPGETYRLTDNLASCAETGLFVQAENITLDCNGFNITSDGSHGNDPAIIINGSSQTPVNITNCGLFDWGNGIVNVSSNTNILNTTINDTSNDGIFGVIASGNITNFTVQNSTFTHISGDALDLQGASGPRAFTNTHLFNNLFVNVFTAMRLGDATEGNRVPPGVTAFTIANNTLHNITSSPTGVLLFGVENTVIANNTFNNTANPVLEVEDATNQPQPSNISILNNHISNISDDGINFDDAMENSTIANNTIINTSSECYFWLTGVYRGLLIEHNIAQDCGAEGYEWDDTTPQSFNLTVQHNQVFTTSDEGFDIDNMLNSTFVNNTANNSGSNGFAINIGVSNDTSLYENNTANGSSTPGFDLIDVLGGSFRRNNASFGGTDGFNLGLTGVENVTLELNNAFNNSGDGFNFVTVAGIALVNNSAFNNTDGGFTAAGGGGGGGGGISLAGSTRISTPTGEVNIADIQPGTVVLNANGKPTTVTKTVKSALPEGITLYRIALADGRAIQGTSEHVLGDGRAISTILEGDRVDGSNVIDVSTYTHYAKYDILTKDGTYLANGVPIQSGMSTFLIQYQQNGVWRTLGHEHFPQHPRTNALTTKQLILPDATSAIRITHTGNKDTAVLSAALLDGNTPEELSAGELDLSRQTITLHWNTPGKTLTITAGEAMNNARLPPRGAIEYAELLDGTRLPTPNADVAQLIPDGGLSPLRVDSCGAAIPLNTYQNAVLRTIHYDQPPDDCSIAYPEPPQAEHTFDVDVFTNNWQDIASFGLPGLPPPDRYSTVTLSVSEGTTRVRIEHQGTDTAHLDAVLLDGRPPQEYTDKLGAYDYDVIDAREKTLELNWKQPGTTLEITGIAEDLIGVPYTWPKDGSTLAYTIGETQTYAYHQPSYSTHPVATRYATFSTVDNALAVHIDWGSDNTLDYGGDWAQLRIFGQNGVQEFEIDHDHTEWGTGTYEYTSLVPWQHKTYDFTIPLSIINSEHGDTIEFQINYYGTGGAPPPGGGAAAGGISFINNTANENGESGFNITGTTVSFERNTGTANILKGFFLNANVTEFRDNTANHNRGANTGGEVIFAPDATGGGGGGGLFFDPETLLTNGTINVTNNTANNNVGTGWIFSNFTSANFYDNNASNNTAVGIQFQLINNSVIENNTMLNNVAGMFVNISNSNTFDGNNISMGVQIFDSDNLTFINTRIESNSTWLSASPGPNTDLTANLTNTTFNNSFDEVFYSGTLTPPNSTNVTFQNFNLSDNSVFLNSSDLSFMNISARLTFFGITFTDPEPIFDIDDDGTFASCPGARCTEVSFAGGTYVYDVTEFTNYSSEEGGAVSTGNGGGGGGSSSGGNTLICPEYCKDPRYSNLDICHRNCPHLQQPDCTENWQCTDWSACLNGEQVRSCVDANNCGTTKNKPGTNKACGTPAPEEDHDTSTTATSAPAVEEQPPAEPTELTQPEREPEQGIGKLATQALPLLLLLAALIAITAYMISRRNTPGPR